jgi:hypothetical protein
VTGLGRRIELKTVPRTSAGLLESDLAWALTHTLTNPFTEVVDRSAANSILVGSFRCVAMKLFVENQAERAGAATSSRRPRPTQIWLTSPPP